jgi:flavodoxin-like protein
MRTLVVYESMYGNTRAIAQAIADGLRPSADVELVPVGQATPRQVTEADLVVVGAPTHAHGMSSASTRRGAGDAIVKPGNTLRLEPEAEAIGVREWLAAMPRANGKAAVAFDTRIKAPSIITGRASSGIAKALHNHGFILATEPESFLVTTQNVLVEGELERAREWAAGLVGGLIAVG